MRNRFGSGLVLGILLSIAVAIIGGYVFITSGMMPANADARPGHLETWAAKTSLNVTVKREMPQGPGPVALTDQNFQRGIKLYAQNCPCCQGIAVCVVARLGAMVLESVRPGGCKSARDCAPANKQSRAYPNWR